MEALIDIDVSNTQFRSEKLLYLSCFEEVDRLRYPQNYQAFQTLLPNKGSILSHHRTVARKVMLFVEMRVRSVTVEMACLLLREIVSCDVSRAAVAASNMKTTTSTESVCSNISNTTSSSANISFFITDQHLAAVEVMNHSNIDRLIIAPVASFHDLFRLSLEVIRGNFVISTPQYDMALVKKSNVSMHDLVLVRTCIAVKVVARRLAPTYTKIPKLVPKSVTKFRWQ